VRKLSWRRFLPADQTGSNGEAQEENSTRDCGQRFLNNSAATQPVQQDRDRQSRAEHHKGYLPRRPAPAILSFGGSGGCSDINRASG